MNKIKIGLLFIGMSSILACEKVIDVDLNDAQPQIVIQADLWEGTQDFKVEIHKTRSYFKNDEEAFVEGALVKLEEIGGSTVNLTDSGNGIYTMENYSAEAGKSYKLIVESEEEIYEAVSEMRNKVILDSLAYEEFPGMFGQPGGYFVFMHFLDPADEMNFYKAYSWKNDEAQTSVNDIWLADDEFTNGNEIRIPLFTQFFELNDTVDISITNIDHDVFDYFTTLSEIARDGGSSSAAPANPNTNWSNHALGYFAALNGDPVRIIIGE